MGVYKILFSLMILLQIHFAKELPAISCGIIDLTGEAEIIRFETNSAIKADTAMKLYDRDHIHTQENSTLTLMTRSGEIVTIPEKSTFIIGDEFKDNFSIKKDELTPHEALLYRKIFNLKKVDYKEKITGIRGNEEDSSSDMIEKLIKKDSCR